MRRHVLSSPTRKAVRAAPLVERLAAGCLNPAAGRLRWRLGRQRVRLLSLGKLPYDADEPLHYSLMQAVVTGFAGELGVEAALRRPAMDSCMRSLCWDHGAIAPCRPGAVNSHVLVFIPV